MSQPVRILLALVLGLTLGIVAAAVQGNWVATSILVAEPIGRLWLNALQMTIIPLVVSLLITGIAATAEAARASRLAAGALILFLIILWISSGLAALLTPFLLELWPMPTDSAGALRDALTAAEPVAPVPGFGEFVAAIVPTNAVSAAAENAILPLIVFTAVFAFALAQLPPEPRERLTGFFRALSEVMLVMIRWILWLAPIGVFALAYVVGARAGAAAFGALLHYVLIVSAVGIVTTLLAYPVGVLGGGVPPGRFSRAVIPAQAVAISTQSSIASLPAMLRGAETLKIPVATAGIVLPLAVAIFRVTGPSMNLAVAIYIAHWLGVELGPAQIAAGVAAAAITTMGAVGLPGQITFITSIAPICMAMGVPIAPLALLIAVENIPDIIRTLGNVTMDVAATATVSRHSGSDAPAAEGEPIEVGSGS